MAETPDMAPWHRLGEELRRRREEDMPPRYANLTLFASERGINHRLAWNLEHGAKASYRRDSIRKAEIAYQLSRGYIDTFIAGGELPQQPERVPRPPDEDGFTRPAYSDTWLEELAQTLEKDPNLPQRDVDGLVRLAAAARQPGATGQQRRGA